MAAGGTAGGKAGGSAAIPLVTVALLLLLPKTGTAGINPNEATTGGAFPKTAGSPPTGDARATTAGGRVTTAGGRVRQVVEVLLLLLSSPALAQTLPPNAINNIPYYLASITLKYIIRKLQ